MSRIQVFDCFAITQKIPSFAICLAVLSTILKRSKLGALGKGSSLITQMALTIA
jgi:hypothetical protein